MNALLSLALLSGTVTLEPETFTFESGLLFGEDGVGGRSLETSAAGEVVVDSSMTEYLFRDWAFQFPGFDLPTKTLTFVDGLGSIDIEIGGTIDDWGFTMPDPVTADLIQTSLGFFAITGFDLVDLNLEPLSGTWFVRGPTETAEGTFSESDLPPDHPTDATALWHRLDDHLDPRKLDGGFEVWTETFATVTVDGVTLDIQTGAQVRGTAEIPEPASLMLAVLATLGVMLWKREQRSR